jgi:hypothetical protein
MFAALNDRMRISDAVENYNVRQTGRMGDFQAALEGALQDFQGARGDLNQSLVQGQQTFRAAGGALNAAEAGAQVDTAAAVESVKGMVDEFNQVSNGLMTQVDNMVGNAYDESKSRAAALMAQISPTVAAQTRAQITDTVASMRAQGIPEAQIQNAAGTIAADGRKQLGDMFTQVGASEGQRLDALRTNLVNTAASVRNTIAGAAAGVYAGAAAETGAAFRNMASVRSAIAQAEAGLATAAANWRTGQATAQAGITNMMAQLAVTGRETLFNMAATIADPVVLMSDILTIGMETDLGLKDLQWQYDMEEYGVEVGISDRMWGTFMSGIGAASSLNAQQAANSAARQAADSQAQGQMVGGALSAAGTVIGAAILVSDQEAKEGFTTVDPVTVLDKVGGLDIKQWSYKDDPGVPHMGPMAQDFKRQFGLGDSDKKIDVVDAMGVALAAIQGLQHEVLHLKQELAHLKGGEVPDG